MIDVVKTVGRAVESQIPGKPHVARGILSAAYQWVAVSNSAKRMHTYAAAVDRFNAAIARTIVKTLNKPQDSVLINIFLPVEILAGMHATPMFPEALSVYVANTQCCGCFAEYAEGQNVPESFCSYHKTMIGMAESGVLPAPALIANTTLACDANQVSFRRLAHDYNVPHVVIDVPNKIDDDAVAYVEDQLYELVAAMEDTFGRPFDTRAFESAIRTANKTIESMKKYQALRGSVSLPTTTTGELCELMAMHLMLGDTSALSFARSLHSLTLKAQPKESVHKPRIMWMHTMPNWQMSMRGIFDGPNSRAELIGIDMTADSLNPIDVNDPMRSLAQRIVYNHLNGTGARRIESCLEQARKLNADGAIVFCHWGCKQTMGVSQLAKRTFEEAGLPTLVLDGDGCDPRNVADGQMVTRVNAFIEQLGGTDACR